MATTSKAGKGNSKAGKGTNAPQAPAAPTYTMPAGLTRPAVRALLHLASNGPTSKPMLYASTGAASAQLGHAAMHAAGQQGKRGIGLLGMGLVQVCPCPVGQRGNLAYTLTPYGVWVAAQLTAGVPVPMPLPPAVVPVTPPAAVVPPAPAPAATPAPRKPKGRPAKLVK